MAESFAIRDRCLILISSQKLRRCFSSVCLLQKLVCASACYLFLPNNKQNQTMDLPRCICSSSMSMFAIDPNHNDMRPNLYDLLRSLLPHLKD
ncbi:hypothetical protein AAC387_Pa03g4086 [Persea americana]